MRAVSRSRISPIITTSGSWRRMARSPRAKVRSTFGFTWVWPIPSMSYSIGSSTVMMLRLRSLSSSKAAYSVVDLPDPVGPVTSRIPCGRWTRRLSRSRVAPSMPSSGRPSLPACLSRSLSTTRSPWLEGKVDTRTSTGLPASRRLIRPSWGRRFSAMSRRAMTLMRDATSDASAGDVDSTSRSTPSTRNLTERRSSNGSKWMSDAWSRSACKSTPLIKRMIGASSSASSRSAGSGSCSASRLRSSSSLRFSATLWASTLPPWYSLEIRSPYSASPSFSMVVAPEMFRRTSRRASRSVGSRATILNRPCSSRPATVTPRRRANPNPGLKSALIRAACSRFGLQKILEFRQQRRLVAPGKNAATIALLELGAPDAAVFPGRQVVHQLLVVKNAGPYEHHEVALDLAGRTVSEQFAEKGDSAQPGNAFHRLVEVVADQAAQHQHGAVGHHDTSRNRALVGDQVHRTGDRRKRGDFLLDGEHYRVAFVDMRRDLELQPDLLALNGLERIDLAFGRRDAFGQEAAGKKRNFLADVDACGMVVHGHDRRRGQHVGVPVGRERLGQRTDLEQFDTEQARGSVDIAQVEPAARKNRRPVLATGQAGAQVEDIAAAGLEVGAAEKARITRLEELPLDAQIPTGIGRDFGDDRLDEHLSPADIQLVDDRTDLAVDRRRGRDDHRVGLLVRVDAHPLTLTLAHLVDQAFEHRDQGLGVGVAQIHHARAAAFGQRRIEVADQRSQAHALAGVAAQNDGIRAGVMNRQRPFRSGINLVGDLGHFLGIGMTQRQDFSAVVGGRVQSFDNRLQPPHAGRPVADQQ